MPIPGHTDYQRREYCKAIKCPVQSDLEKAAKGSREYEEVRGRCRDACVHTTFEFHHWLTDHGYLVVRPNP
jgi:hypothetical protein